MGEFQEAGAPAARRGFRTSTPLLALLAAAFTTATVAWTQIPTAQPPPQGAQQPPAGARQFHWPDRMRNRQGKPTVRGGLDDGPAMGLAAIAG